MTDHGSFSVNKPTRDYFGDGVIKFIEKNMLVRDNVPLASRADCATETAKRSLKTIFGEAATAEGKDAFCAGMEKESKIGPLNLRMVEQDSKKTVNAIVFPSTAEHTLSIASGIKGFKNGFAPKSIDTFFLMHEVHHENRYAANPSYHKHVTADGKFKGSDGYEEFESDLVARKMYGKALKEKLVADSGVPDAVRGGRALMAMTTPSKYDVASLAGVPGVAIKNERDHKDAGTAINTVRDRVFQEIGKDVLSDEDKDKSKYQALKHLVTKAPKGTFNQGDVKGFAKEPTDYNAFKSHVKSTLSSVQVPEKLKQEHATLEKTYKSVAEKDIGKVVAEEHPGLAYETIRRMSLKGSFDDNAYGKAYAREFVRAAETYAPEHFQTQGQKTYKQDLSATPSYAPASVAANNAQFQISA